MCRSMVTRANSSFGLSRQPVQKKENFELKPALLRLKIDFVSHHARGGGVR